MSAVWMFFLAVLLAQMVLVLILCLPMPSNRLRGFIVNIFETAWSRSPKLRAFVQMIACATAIMFLDSMRSIYMLDEKLDKGSTGATAELMMKLRLFHSQRNAYITGFSLFLMLVLYRFQDLISQLHQARSAVLGAKTLAENTEPAVVKKQQ
eukprot:TRINITY_DN4338_c0_g1_i1.p1 TRINITY_DN4338_c0_g1~~TRINITY_DN4338_c0_g1_i1.p1  ORF type:complete len:152 (-),score=24.12 TRINITY_DN4338_c0_g1_i1:253-708(-)